MNVAAPILVIARHTLREGVRNRLLWLLLLAACGAIAASGLLRDVALTESRQLQSALLAAVLRLAAVFLVATFVVTSMVREANDKGQELLLALPLPRVAWLLGKLAGFAALAVLPAALFGTLALLVAPAAQALLWSVSLLAELWIVAAFSVLCMLTLHQVLPALAAACAFYLLARTAAALQLLAHGPGQHDGLLTRAIDALALLLPNLDAYARTDWLLYHGGTGADLAAIAIQSAIYLALLTAAALFDLYRKNF